MSRWSLIKPCKRLESSSWPAPVWVALAALSFVAFAACFPAKGASVNGVLIAYDTVEGLAILGAIWLATLAYPCAAYRITQSFRFLDCFRALIIASPVHFGLCLLPMYWLNLCLHYVCFYVILWTYLRMESGRPIASLLVSVPLATGNNAVLYGCYFFGSLDTIPRFMGSSASIGMTVIATVAFPVGIAIAIEKLCFRRTRESDDHPMCDACGYDLYGNTSRRCPECGRNVQILERS